MAISGYENEDKKTYHIILPEYIINNKKELLELKKIVKCINKNDCPYFDISYESKLFWEGYDATINEDPIAIKDEWNDEIDIFNGHDIIEENIKI